MSKKVIVACGSGIATSKMVAQKITKLLEERDVEADVQAAEVKDLARTLDHALQCIDYTHDENGKAICGNLDHLTSNVADINDRLLDLN